MTARRKTSGTEESSTNQLEIVKWGMSTNVFRLGLFILVLSMHPLGRQVLGTFGFKFPDERQLVVATEEAKGAKSEIASIAENVKTLTSDVASIKANNVVLNEKVDRLDKTFTGFQVDFNKWKPVTQP